MKKGIHVFLMSMIIFGSILYSNSNSITQTRYASYLKGTMSFSKKGNKVYDGKAISVVKNPGYYTGMYKNTYKKAVLINNGTEYKIQSAGMWWDLGDSKSTVMYLDIPGFK